MRFHPLTAIPGCLALGISLEVSDFAVPASAAPEARPDRATAFGRSPERDAMVREQIAGRGVKDVRVLTALRQVPRHEFVPEPYRNLAYEDSPLPIGEDQTISQPYIVAFMSEQLGLRGNERVLEVGTGSGYQAAVLARLAAEVYTIEIVPLLARRAAVDLERLGYHNVHVREGDGYRGWPEASPFDAIMVTAAPDHVPAPLLSQLANGGRMILPVGDSFQQLVLLTKTPQGCLRERRLLPVRFVPMTGEAKGR